MPITIRHRELIAAIAGAMVAWPFAARAQQGERMRRIGVLLPATSDDPVFQDRVGAFLQGLERSGWTIGRNVRIDTRWARPTPPKFANTRQTWPRSRLTSS